MTPSAKDQPMQFDTDMKAAHKELFGAVRNLLLKDYELVETKKVRITTYADVNGGICHMRTMKHGIDIGFLKGVHMEDKYSLLTGSGKVMRVLPMSDFDVVIVKYFVDQAVKINAARQ